MTLSPILAFVRREPVAVALGSIIAALVTYGVSRGVVDDSLAPFILAGAAILLGVPVTGVVRSQVTPSVKVPTVVADATDAALDRARGEVVDRFGEQGGAVLDVVSSEVSTYLGRHRS